MSSRPLPELLAPAGSPEALRAAVEAGADAVYFGGHLFNARMNARNFDRDDITEAVRFCHERGVRCYITFNTLLTDRQMKEALEYADFLYHAGVDALIITDIGLITLLREALPDLPLHASTQMSGHNAEAARYLHSLGITRMVAARELSRTALETLCRESPIEIEAFVHGALCVCHSGQCLLSSMIGGRSGNRGECAQPCRMPYGNGYPLSLKDNCLAGHIEELLNMGVASLKLEGRMKSPDYVAAVVSCYRRLLDERRNATEEEIAALARVFSRQGFTDGYFTGKLGREMLGVRTEENKSESRLSARRPHGRRTLPPVVPPERKNAITPAFLFAATKPERSTSVPPQTTARFARSDAIPQSERFLSAFDILYLPLEQFPAGARRFPGKIKGVILPPVVTDPELPAVRAALAEAKALGAEHLLFCNIGEISIAVESGLHIHGDYRLNLTNRHAVRQLLTVAEDVILSPELILPQIRDLPRPASVIVYGRLPLMTLEKPVGRPSLTDRTGAQFPIIKEGGRDILLNCVPIYMADYGERLRAANIGSRHFLFTTEGPQECESVENAYRKGLPTKKPIRRVK